DRHATLAPRSTGHAFRGSAVRRVRGPACACAWRIARSERGDAPSPQRQLLARVATMVPLQRTDRADAAAAAARPGAPFVVPAADVAAAGGGGSARDGARRRRSLGFSATRRR